MERVCKAPVPFKFLKHFVYSRLTVRTRLIEFSNAFFMSINECVSLDKYSKSKSLFY